MKTIQFLASITLASLPLYIVRCKNFSWCSSPLPFTFLELLVLATFSAWFIWRTSQVREGIISPQRVFRGLTGPLFWPLLLFLAISAISVFVSPDMKAAAGIWKAYFFEPALLFTVVLDLTIIKKSPFWVGPPLLFSGLWISLLAIWQAASGVNQFAPYAIAQGRATSIYTTPNALGLYLGPLAMTALGFLVQLYKQREISLKKFGSPVYLIICLISFILAIYFSKSRGAGLGVSISLLVFVLLLIFPKLPSLWRNVFKFGALFAAAVYLLLNIFIFVRIDSFVAAYRPPSQDSIAARFCLWQATRNLLADRPITGVGVAAYQKIYPSYATCYSEAQLYPHNILLNFWTEMGLAGTFVFLWTAFISFKILARSFKNFISVGLFAALVYIFVHGLVDVPYFKNDLASEFWVFLALIAWFARSEK